MDLKKRLKQERETGLSNIVDKPWFPVVVFLIFAAVIGPEIYRHFKKPTIEDCADITFTFQYTWDPKFIGQTASRKLQTNSQYEKHWQDCEREKQKFPEKFDEKYKGIRKDINERLLKKSVWNDKKN